MEILRGKEKLAHEVDLFVFDKFARIDRCNAKIHMNFGSVMKEINKNSHNSPAADVEVAKVHTAFKPRAGETVLSRRCWVGSDESSIKIGLHTEKWNPKGKDKSSWHENSADQGAAFNDDYFGVDWRGNIITQF